MRRLEMRPIVRKLVVLDYNKTGDEGKYSDIVEGGMGVCADLFLGWCVRRLEDQDALGYQ